MVWDCQSGGLAASAVPISIQRLDILGLESDGRAGCFVSIEYRVADQGQVDRLIGFEERTVRGEDSGVPVARSLPKR